MLNKRNKLILQISAAVIAIALLLHTCNGRSPTSDLKLYVEQLKVNSMKHLKPQINLAVKLPTPVVYDENAHRPPFGNIPKIEQNNGVSSTYQSNPLLAYSLSVLKFVGTVSQATGTFAFILAPDGMIYQVGLGNEIGDRHGKVVDIQENRLQVMEQKAMNGNESGQSIVTLQLKDEPS